MTKPEWAKFMRPASYKGVPFFVKTARRTGGRSIVNHEFAGRDDNFAEDKGKLSHSFPIIGHVTGDDYMDQRDALIEALESKGAGILIHPYYGRENVVAATNEILEESVKGRTATITMLFIPAGEYRYPVKLVDVNAELLEAVAGTIKASKGMIEMALDIAAIPGEAVRLASFMVEKAGDALGKVLAPFAKLRNIAAQLSYSIRNIKAEVNTLLAAPGELADRLLASFDMVKDAIDSPEDSVTAFKGLYTFGADTVGAPPPPPADTVTRSRIKKNNDAIANFMKTVAVAKVCQMVIEVDFPSVAEASAERESIVAFIDELMEDPDVNPSDDLYQALSDLAANVVSALPDERSDLPAVIEYIPFETMSSLVLTYEIYQDINKEQDIISRNKIPHPGFIPGGEALEIVS